MISKFTDIGISLDIARAMDDMGWEKPTPIQIKAISEGLKGIDLFGQAQTGTGKTGAYGSIILGRTFSRRKVPSAIVLVPTRELALQVAEELEKLSRYTGHKIVPIYGGSGKRADIDIQIMELNEGSDVIVGTPGRVKDMIIRGALNLTDIKELVLDEADRMLDMGFIEDINFIMKTMPRKKHTLLFSATMPECVKALAYGYMHKPKEISVSQDELVLNLTKQYYASVGRKNKIWALCKILDIDRPKAIIFCQTKKMVDILEEKLIKFHYKAEAIHGDLPQSKRESVIKNVRNGKIDILVATDVAARGLDIDDITYVINYDMPDDVDVYIHRIGRTGRAGKEGTAVSFVTSEEQHFIKEFELRTGMKIDKREIPEDEGVTDAVKKVTDYDQISNVFGMVKFEINLGRNDGYGEGSLINFITCNAKVRDIAIGKVQIGMESSIVEVHKDFGDKMIMNLCKREYHGKHVSVKAIQN
ncbi:MAG: DEAD/DEAH box helicase [archaeon]|nr:DEAD/DEAH box helicase [archaeon]